MTAGAPANEARVSTGASRERASQISGLLRNRGLRDEIDQSPLLGPAEGLEDALLASRRDCIAGERLLILVRPRENRQQFLEQRKVLMLDGGIERSLHAMIARNEGGIDASHRLGALARPTALARQTRPPPRRPSVVCRGVREQAADSRVGLLVDSRVAQLAKGQREVGPILVHRCEPFANEIEII